MSEAHGGSGRLHTSPAAWGRRGRRAPAAGGVLLLVGTGGQHPAYVRTALAELTRTWRLALADPAPISPGLENYISEHIRPAQMTLRAMEAMLRVREDPRPICAVIALDPSMTALSARVAHELGLPGYGGAAAELAAFPARALGALAAAGLPIAPSLPAELIADCLISRYHPFVAALTRTLQPGRAVLDEVVDVDDEALKDARLHQLITHALQVLGVQNGLTRLHLRHDGRRYVITGLTPGLGRDLGRTVGLATGINLVRELATIACGLPDARDLPYTECAVARRAWLPSPPPTPAVGQIVDRMLGMSWLHELIPPSAADPAHRQGAEAIVTGGDAEQCEQWLRRLQNVLAEALWGE
ncbi:hypothetical protein ACIBHX_46770 [Nonomuraea sp. NPDC050536]|uniref:hypothetical protein n=1 Tax=Nonomuraea sp. NPDC050536 TaxID=3364366 RepID=UPI0037C7935D